MATKQAYKIGDIPQIVSHMLLMFITMFYDKKVIFDKDVHRKKIFNEKLQIVAMATFCLLSSEAFIGIFHMELLLH